ncbi:pyrimidine dimer DNA glycosylase/endonuclease V [Brachybacterium sp. YJGR34]|uniref:pyrimidine dimer DNA glycosylase/endonuclease V n=1 Tax=Brachybacterium sp. YJGR34 TaxID=2059911 RepID=UPI000E0B9BE0|nr:pyrimidine dimer DNA glycosylase/endonuclease V [Brachybacterium sp. YJGR34]
MRLWSLHPQHLDRQGLTGGWREALLAQAVLAGRTRGYRAHPQLERFREHPDPLGAMGSYLTALAEEASARGYRFDRSRIDPRVPSAPMPSPIPVTEGQIALEWHHLLDKLEARSPERWARSTALDGPALHPLFRLVPGPVASWERAELPTGSTGRTGTPGR